MGLLRYFFYLGLLLFSFLNPLLGWTQGHAVREPVTPQNQSNVAEAPIEDPVIKLPPEFTITERIISLTSSFKIENGNQLIGNIDKKIFSFGTQFEMKDASGKKIGHAKQKVFSWGVEIDVFDEKERKIGTVKEIISKSWLKIFTEYQILDASGKQIAKSEKKDWGDTDLKVTNMNGSVIVSMSRPWLQFRLTDQWTVKLRNEEPIDPRLFLTMSAFKTDKDNARIKERLDDSNLKND